jgi:hypothetical protein
MKVIPIIGNYLSKLREELQLMGYGVDGKFAKADLNSISNDIASLVDDAYERGYRAGGGYGAQQANKALMDQIVALAHSVETIIRARQDTIKRTGVRPAASEIAAFQRAEQCLRNLSGSGHGGAGGSGDDKG